MARTPLLRSLTALAAEHRIAAARGITPTQLREQKAAARDAHSRREFLGRAGLTAAALSLGTTPLRAAATAQPRIAIIGGGIAGLSATLTLADAGLRSTVYEASGRIGGRMHSDRSGYWLDNQISESCGELIDTGHKTILHLAQRFGLATADLVGAEPNGSEDTYRFFGQYYRKSQADTDFQPVHNALQGDVAAASYPTTYKINTAAGIAPRQHERP